MTENQLCEIIELGKINPLPIEIVTSDVVNSVLRINDLIALPILKIKNSYSKDSIIEVKLEGTAVGHVCIMKGKSKDFNAMTEFEFVTFMTESNDVSDYYLPTYTFQNDYLILREDFYEEYSNHYLKSAPLWGGFSHVINYSEPTTNFIDTPSSIELGNKLKDFDKYSYESVIRAIEQPYAFERFLKLYHLLELNFDYFLVQKIKDLEIPEDSNTIGALLNSYSRNEIERLNVLIKEHCIDIESLVSKLDNVLVYKSIAEQIFLKFGTGKQPLMEVEKFDKVFASNSFSSSNLKSLNIVTEAKHSDFVLKLVSYWIYRVRCSIAHNKIGEYLLSWEDEEFLVNFAEPLLLEVLKQFYKA